MTTPHLIAHVINATTEPVVELEVATCDGDEWFTNDGQQVWPYWTQRIDTLFHMPDPYEAAVALEIPTIPDGWLAHLTAEADKMAARASYHKSIGLLSAIGLSAPAPVAKPAPIKRRI